MNKTRKRRLQGGTVTEWHFTTNGTGYKLTKVKLEATPLWALARAHTKGDSPAVVWWEAVGGWRGGNLRNAKRKTKELLDETIP
jgi:hypothetical protein